MGTNRIYKSNVQTWAFVSELSDSRLSNYGNMTSGRFQNFDSPYLTSNGVPVSNEGFNNALASEYQKRHGKVPEWFINDTQKQNRADVINKK